ncbi:MAG: EthD domain-containing protein [Steroidobacteraceae bacterium]
MIKTYAFIVKKAGLSDEQFHAHWRDPHGVMTTRIPHFVRYLQNHGVGPDCRLPPFPAVPFRGVPVIWTRGLEDLAAAAEHPDWPPLAEDGGLFYEVDQLAFVPCRETAERGGDPGPGPHTKAMVFVRGADSLDDAVLLNELIAAWPVVAWAGAARPVPEANPPPGPFFDLALEFILPGVEAQGEALAAGCVKLAGVINATSSLQPVGGFLCREERVFDRR